MLHSGTDFYWWNFLNLHFLDGWKRWIQRSYLWTWRRGCETCHWAPALADFVECCHQKARPHKPRHIKPRLSSARQGQQEMSTGFSNKNYKPKLENTHPYIYFRPVVLFSFEQLRCSVGWTATPRLQELSFWKHVTEAKVYQRKEGNHSSCF